MSARVMTEGDGPANWTCNRISPHSPAATLPAPTNSAANLHLGREAPPRSRLARWVGSLGADAALEGDARATRRQSGPRTRMPPPT
jgi:hypothetical protein